MTADSLHVERFEFLLQRNGHEDEWLPVRGPAGCYCDGCLHDLHARTDRGLETALAKALRVLALHEQHDELWVYMDGRGSHVQGRVVAAQAVARNGTVRCVVWRDQP